MARYLVRYHRAILDTAGRVLFPGGSILTSMDRVPAEQHDRIVVLEDEAPAKPAAPEKVAPAAAAKVIDVDEDDEEDDDEEC